MFLTVYTKTGAAKINADNPQPYHFTSRKYSPLYRAVEAYFEQWINQPHQTEARQQYFGSFEEMEGESYLNHRGAIAEGVQVVIDYMLENGLQVLNTRMFGQLDLEGVFQP